MFRKKVIGITVNVGGNKRLWCLKLELVLEKDELEPKTYGVAS